MKIHNRKLSLIIVLIISTLVIIVGCSGAGSRQSADPAANNGAGVEMIEEETFDPDELSDYVDDYVIDIQEDDSIIIN